MSVKRLVENNLAISHDHQTRTTKKYLLYVIERRKLYFYLFSDSYTPNLPWPRVLKHAALNSHFRMRRYFDPQWIRANPQSSNDWGTRWAD